MPGQDYLEQPDTVASLQTKQKPPNQEEEEEEQGQEEGGERPRGRRGVRAEDKELGVEKKGTGGPIRRLPENPASKQGSLRLPTIFT
mmetsp:Transcript_20370/g.50926  ORF Transcript_20370/g.50926 Transcript_20370/m.50926 type:complete len:87 (+) Transcript_20370:80-340(+)